MQNASLWVKIKMLPGLSCVQKFQGRIRFFASCTLDSLLSPKPAKQVQPFSLLITPTLTLLPLSVAYKDSCDYTWTSWIIQVNPPISNS